MSEFIYKQNDNETYTIMAYHGNEETVSIDAIHADKPVVILYDSLFKNHKEIKHVILPDTIEDIGGFMFDGCENIHEIRLPAGLKNLWQYAFVRSSIEEIEIPEGVSTIPPFAFKDCRNLKKIICHKGLRKIYDYAFQGCDGLEEVIIDPLTEVGEKAFDDRTSKKERK